MFAALRNFSDPFLALLVPISTFITTRVVALHASIAAVFMRFAQPQILNIVVQAVPVDMVYLVREKPVMHQENYAMQ